MTNDKQLCFGCSVVISGGLDSKLVMWDFSKGRPYKIVDFGKLLFSASTA